jgi:prolyl-tRNA editing enzyme YbaK/EbsC (Cys-tRNA(Pro) deacylase)
VAAWPEAVERVAGFLRESGAEVRVEEFPGGTPTAREAAEAVGCELAQIVKSLVFDCDGKAVVVLVPGDRRADRAKIARAVGSAKARVADPGAVERATGFPPGAVAPFPLPQVDRVLMDRLLLGQEIVWVGAGSDRHMAGLAPSELRRLARAEPMDAVQSGT